MTSPLGFNHQPVPRFICAAAEYDEGADHETVPVFMRCQWCREWVVGGYECETCGHEDTAAPDSVPGHGSNRCVVELP
jgi:Zn ribbon nucleic-acid-binding protein